MKYRDQGYATLPQVKALLTSGVDELTARNLSIDAARVALAEIDHTRKMSAPSQGELF